MAIKNTLWILIILFLTFSQSCLLTSFGEWDISGISILKIEGSSKVVYKYDAWGGLDSHASGYKLLDSTEQFIVNQREDLPFMDLIRIPTKNRISGLSHKCDNSCGEYYAKSVPNYKPIEINKSKNRKIEIEHIIYQYKGYSQTDKGFDKFEFENFTETRDSLFFFNLNDNKSMKKKHLDSLKIKKRMVEIQNCNNKNTVAIIIVEDFNINEIDKEIISHKTYHLIPENPIKIEEFSNYGIFKPAKN